MGDLNPFDSSRGIGKSIKKTIKDPTRIVTKPVETLVTDPIKKGAEIATKASGTIAQEGGEALQAANQFSSTPLGGAFSTAFGLPPIGGIFPGSQVTPANNLTTQAQQFQNRKNRETQPVISSSPIPTNYLVIGGAAILAFILIMRRK